MGWLAGDVGVTRFSVASPRFGTLLALFACGLVACGGPDSDDAANATNGAGDTGDGASSTGTNAGDAGGASSGSSSVTGSDGANATSGGAGADGGSDANSNLTGSGGSNTSAGSDSGGSTGTDGTSTDGTGTNDTSTGTGGTGTSDTSSDDTSTTGTGTTGAGGTGSGADCVIHVDGATGDDAADGSSWELAKATIQAGIEAAVGELCEVWVAEGSYLPAYKVDPFADARTATLMLRDGVAVFGGFAGSETSFAEREVAAHPTTITGEIGDAGTTDDNLRHVVTTEPGLTGASFRLDGFTITRGNASTESGGGLLCSAGELTLGSNTFSDNRAERGAAIAVWTSCTLTLANSSFLQNLAIKNPNLVDPSRGGAIYSEGALRVDTSSFVENDADHGGAIWASKSVELLASSFDGNTSASFGGALIAQNAITTIDSCEFSNNSTGISGGAIQAQDSDGVDADDVEDLLTITGSTFSDNLSSTLGGAIRAAIPGIVVEQSTFDGNESGSGGAILGSELVITGTDFIGNVATSGGGALYLSGGSIDASHFENNQSQLGGGIYAPLSDGRLELEDSVLIGNSSTGTGEGGGLYIHCVTNCEVAVDGVAFEENTATLGGAVFLMGNFCASVLDFANLVFLANTATSHGGALYKETTCPVVSLRHATFFGNTAGGNGGALYNNSDSALLTNNIFWGNSAVGEGPQIFNNNGAVLTLRNNNVQGSGFTGANGNIDQNPLFMSTAAGSVDLSLQALSPSINAGSNADIALDLLDRDADSNTTEPTPFDITGAARIQGSGAVTDMGAYESAE